MSFQLEGKLIEKFDSIHVSDSFTKREFVIETEENNYTETIKFQLIQDACDYLDSHNVGDNINVHFNVKGRKWEKEGKTSYFINLHAWRLEKSNQHTPPQAKSKPFPEVESKDSGDALPF